MDYNSFIGKRVKKKNGRNFRSGNIYNTVKEYKYFKKTGTHLFTFVEDSSTMKCQNCFLEDTTDYHHIIENIKAISGVECSLNDSFKTFRTYGVEELSLFNNRIKDATESNEKYFYMYGHRFKTKSHRYQLFTHREQKCPRCGMKASFWAIQKSKSQDCEHPHLNLYGINEKGEAVMFTKDHILPRSLGGEDKVDNYEIMCSCCNEEKSNDIKDNPNFITYEFQSVRLHSNKLNGKTYIISTNEKNKKIEIDTSDLEQLLGRKIWIE